MNDALKTVLLKTLMLDAHATGRMALPETPQNLGDDDEALSCEVEFEGTIDLDRLTTAIHDHFAILLTNIHGAALREAFVAAMVTDKVVTLDERGRLHQGDRELKTDQMIHVFATRLIEGLSK